MTNSQEKIGVGVELGLEGWMEYGCTGSLFTEAEIVTMGAVQGRFSFEFFGMFSRKTAFELVWPNSITIYNCLRVNILTCDMAGYRSMKISCWCEEPSVLWDGLEMR